MAVLVSRHPLAALALSLAITTSITTFSAPALAQAPEVPISEAARTHFSAGVRLLQDPGGARYEEAYQEFKVAYADSPSPRILGNIGLCAMRLERDEEAIHAFEAYLAQAPKIEPVERKQIESDLRTLRASMVRVTLTVSTSDVRIVDVRTPIQGAPVTNVYGPLPAGAIQLGLHPGHHVLTVKREGYAPSAWEIDGVPSAVLARAITLEPLGSPGDTRPVSPTPVVPAPPMAPVAPITPVTPIAPLPEDDAVTRPTPNAVWALTGISLAFGLAGAITGGLAVAKHDDYTTINDGTRIPDAQSLHDSGQRLNVATDVLLGTAIAGAVVTIVVYATRPRVSVPAPVALSPNARGFALTF